MCVLRVHGQGLLHLGEQQSVFAVLQHGQGERCFQHALQSGFIAAQGQREVAGIHHQFGNRGCAAKQNGPLKHQGIHRLVCRCFKRKVHLLKGDARINEPTSDAIQIAKDRQHAKFALLAQVF